MPGAVKKGVVAAGQKSLLSFFSPKSSSEAVSKGSKQIENSSSKDNICKLMESNENALSVGDEDENDELFQKSLLTPPAKKLKLDEPESQTSDSGNSSLGATPLTPEQKKMINEKAMAAKSLRRLKETQKSLAILDPQMGTSWFTALESEFQKKYFKELNDFVLSSRNRTTVYPPANNVWEWTKYFPIHEVKVVILGQDPYHGPNQAHGLCFSVKKGVAPPPSLVNMYKELATDIPGFKTPNHGCLTGWAEQGVLLLNAVLTVESARANAHKDKGWEKVTDAVISWISKNVDSVVFLLWGSYAQKKGVVVDKNKHHLLQTVHPSPLSAHRGFFGSNHFSKCNELLKKNGKKPIDWNHLP